MSKRKTLKICVADSQDFAQLNQVLMDHDAEAKKIEVAGKKFARWVYQTLDWRFVDAYQAEYERLRK